jgi:hypothetical protein
MHNRYDLSFFFTIAEEWENLEFESPNVTHFYLANVLPISQLLLEDDCKKGFESKFERTFSSSLDLEVFNEVKQGNDRIAISNFIFEGRKKTSPVFWILSKQFEFRCNLLASSA